MVKVQRYFNKFAILVYFVIVVCLAIYNFIKPYYSYDLIPYIASTISLEQSNKEIIHDQTYKIVRDALPDDVYKELTSGDFGHTMLTDSVSFNQQLNFYTVKPLYIFLIYLIHKLGLGIVSAINLISMLSYIGISVLLFLFINRLRSGYLGMVILSLLMICQPLILMAGRNTPDTLSAFIILLSIFLILNKKIKFLAGTFLVFSIAIRPDNLIICGILLVYFGLLSPKEYRFKLYQASVLLLLSIIFYFSIGHIEQSYGWKTLFTIAFLHFIQYPADTNVHITVKEYVDVLFTNGISVLSTHLLYFIVLGLTGLIVPNLNQTNVYKHLIMISTGVMIFYFLLFPSKEVDRYFITEYLIIIALSLRILCDNFVIDKLVQPKVLN
ncbi:hypothetical protein [Neobacillus cucumis]|uniref:hypothetical protein n=1 Tax=Neobacillus cucumis TaxID=1740721 RepID=UPI0019646800|nr:hypothetical protein [Neobacillus cucumis]MBM7651847.1 hypothetical protein [Neobacillus cucumis]